jgi:hypothetical protein
VPSPANPISDCRFLLTQAKQSNDKATKKQSLKVEQENNNNIIKSLRLMKEGIKFRHVLKLHEANLNERRKDINVAK